MPLRRVCNRNGGVLCISTLRLHHPLPLAVVHTHMAERLVKAGGAASEGSLQEVCFVQRAVL